MVIGGIFENRLDKFEDLRRKLRRAGINKSLRMYLSSAVFYGIVVGVSTTILFGFLFFFIGVNPIVAILMGIIFGISTYSGFFLYPSYQIGERKRLLEASLPTASSYMTAMASAGVTPDKIFMSLARDDIDLFIKEDAKKISRDIEIFNMDIIRALEAAARRSPSSKYSTFLEGIVSTFTSGGDLQMYFQSASEGLMRDKVATEKAFIENLGLMAELYLVACIVLPTFIVVVIAMMGLQGTFSHTTLTFVVIILTLFIIPVLQAVIILLVDGLQPEE